MSGRGTTETDSGKYSSEDNEQSIVSDGASAGGADMIFCGNATCRYNDGTGCTAKDIHIGIEYGSMEQGKHHVYNICQNYEVKEDAVSD